MFTKYTHNSRLPLTRTLFTRSKPDQPRPEEAKVDRHRHISEPNRKFQKLMRWEVFPLLMLSAAAIAYFQFRTQILNILPLNKLKIDPYSDKEERFIGRKLNGLL